MEIRIGVFIQSVSRHALWCTSQSRAEGADREVVATDGTEYNAFAHCLGSHGSAFGNFAGMPGEPLGKAAQDWKGGVQGRVAAASSKHKVNASFQRTL